MYAINQRVKTMWAGEVVSAWIVAEIRNGFYRVKLGNGADALRYAEDMEI